MKRKGAVVISAASALVCIFAVIGYTSQVREEAAQVRSEALSRYGGEQIEVCVATEDIAAGQNVTSDNTASKVWLVDLLPDDAVESFDDIAGKRVTSSIVAGEVISNRHFEGASLDISVPNGLQAVSVEVDQAQAVGGALDVGAIVDVYSVGSIETAQLVNGAYVASCGNGSGSRIWITLAVEPDQVEQIIAATQNSTLYFTLPSQGERGDYRDDQQM